jgi:hypothetical protein
MIRALKVVMIIWGVLGILFGLAYIFVPYQLGAMLGYEQGPAYIGYMLAGLAGCFISVSVFMIVAARDPLRHINWVKFAILYCTLGVVLGLYSIIRGYVNFGQAGMGIIIDAVFAVAFLALYPWRAARSGE